MHKPNKGMKALKDLIESGEVKPVIDKCFPLSEAVDAFNYFGEGQFKGKVVITMPTQY
jgi:NADPH:quinone reductase-like Zn-dependent oxidoreductase